MRGESSRPGGGRKTLIAVDFGTTHSAMAWMQIRSTAPPSDQSTRGTQASVGSSSSGTFERVLLTVIRSGYSTCRRKRLPVAMSWHVRAEITHARVLAGVEGSERIEIMQWFLEKGAKIKESEPVSFQYYFDMSENDMNLQGGKLDLVTVTVYTCNEDPRPDYPDPGKCKQLVKLTADLNQIPKGKMRKERGTDNLWYYKIWFHIRMTCHSANISFDLLHDGIKYSSVKAEYR
ncbi:hypothetical protein ANO14919_024300 [Xylariales sp. No.14919]|nr:hypothetical protein ANO14919_024300 [Xylariales sp. No.14919]